MTAQDTLKPITRRADQLLKKKQKQYAYDKSKDLSRYSTFCKVELTKGEAVGCCGTILVVLLGDYRPAHDKNYPNWHHVVPGYRENDLPEFQQLHRKQVDVAELWGKVKLGRAVGQDRDGMTCGKLYVNGYVDLTAANTDWSRKDSGGVMFQSCRKVSEKDFAMKLDMLKVYDALKIFRKVKETRLELRWNDADSPLVIVGEKAYAVIMPVR